MNGLVGLDVTRPRRRSTHHLRREDLTAFQRIDDRRAVASIVFDYAVVVTAAAAASWLDRAAVTVLVLVIIAGRQSALQGLLHSACHYTLFSNRRHNDALAFLYAYPLLDSVPLYREQHLEHHRDFNRRTPDRFDYLLNSLQLSRRGVWARTWVVFVRPVLGYAGCVFLADVVRAFHENRRQARAVIAFWAVLLTAAWFGGFLRPLVVFWVVPLVWLYPVLDIWAELSDHLDARDESRNQEGFFYSFLLKGHETYHAVHHWFPSVPYYRLRDLRNQLRNRGVMMETSSGPLDFLRIVYRPAERSIGDEAATRGVGAWTT